MPITYIPDLTKADGQGVPTIYDLTSKDAVYAATTEDVVLAGLQTIDGIAVPDGARVLVKQQNDAAENGIWITHPGAWHRSTDSDTWDHLVGASTLVLFGDTTALSLWVTDIWSGGVLNYDGIGWNEVTSGLSPVHQGRGIVVAGQTVHAVRSASYDSNGVVYANSASGLTFLVPNAGATNQYLSTTNGGTPGYRDVVIGDVTGLQDALDSAATDIDMSREQNYRVVNDGTLNDNVSQTLTIAQLALSFTGTDAYELAQEQAYRVINDGTLNTNVSNLTSYLDQEQNYRVVNDGTLNTNVSNLTSYLAQEQEYRVINDGTLNTNVSNLTSYLAQEQEYRVINDGTLNTNVSNLTSYLDQEQNYRVINDGTLNTNVSNLTSSLNQEQNYRVVNDGTLVIRSGDSMTGPLSVSGLLTTSGSIAALSNVTCSKTSDVFGANTLMDVSLTSSAPFGIKRSLNVGAYYTTAGNTAQYLSGIASSVTHGGSGALFGSNSIIANEIYHGKGVTGTGTIARSIGLYAQTINQNKIGEITESRDIFIPTPVTTSPGGTISTNYPIYQQNTAGINYFAGYVAIGTTTANSNWTSGASMAIKTVAVTTGTTTLGLTHHHVQGNTSGGNITLQLPTATSIIGREYRIKKINASNTLNVVANAAETIDGNINYPMTALYAHVEIVSDGANWMIT